MRQVIKDLSGSAMPKLNWSSPRDAVWIATSNNMKCDVPDDVFLLLQSSDFVNHDLSMPFEYASDKTPLEDENYELVLKKWVDIIPSMEFRCFVKERILVGMRMLYYRMRYF
jgi:hypothetical protein